MGGTALYQISKEPVAPICVHVFSDELIPKLSRGKNDSLSSQYKMRPMPHCRKLLMHCVVFARPLALASAGSRSAARIAMIAITTSNSMSVNALGLFLSNDMGRSEFFSGILKH